jgi:hypothetical protein
VAFRLIAPSPLSPHAPRSKSATLTLWCTASLWRTGWLRRKGLRIWRPASIITRNASVATRAVESNMVICTEIDASYDRLRTLSQEVHRGSIRLKGVLVE